MERSYDAKEALLDIDLTIYPNPGATNDLVNIKSSFPINDIQIFNAAGQLVRTIEGNKNNQVEIPLNNLNAGIYFIQINNEYFKKLIVE